MQDELSRGGAWILGAADKGLFLGDNSGEQNSLTARIKGACATRSTDDTVVADDGCIGDGIHHWNQLYKALRPDEADLLSTDDDLHNDEMIRRWVQAYLRQVGSDDAGALPPATISLEQLELRAGMILRCSATKWVLGRPDGTWPSRRNEDPWRLPGQYLHKAVVMLLEDSTHDRPSKFVLLNGPSIGKVGSDVVQFGGVVGLNERKFLPLPSGGGRIGYFEFPAGVLQDLLLQDFLCVAKHLDCNAVMEVDVERRWELAGGTLNTMQDVASAAQGDKQARKWYRAILGVDVE